MKFNPITNKLYTDKDEFIKTLACPYFIDWDKLEQDSPISRMCNKCNHQVIDTAHLADDALLQLVQTNPKTCLKIDLNQENLTLASDIILNSFGDGDMAITTFNI